MSNSSDDVFTALLVGVVSLSIVGPLVVWQKFTGWLLDAGVIVSAAGDPVVVLPSADGAGFDAARVVAVLSVVAVVVAGSVLWRQKRKVQTL